MFCRTTLPWYYLNRFDRLKVEAGAVHYSGGVIARTEDGNKVIRNGKFLLRENDDLFVPALWNSKKEIVAYSRLGYTDKAWQLPADWASVQHVTVQNITLQGLASDKTRIPVIDGTLRLTLQADQAVSILPAGPRR
jgi:hypothetical protein